MRRLGWGPSASVPPAYDPVMIMGRSCSDEVPSHLSGRIPYP